MYDIIIVGGGTAGFSAAIYAARAGRTSVILEAAIYGGQIINSPEIENYPAIKHTSGYEFANDLYEQAVSLGAEIKYEKVVGIREKEGIKTVITEKGEYFGRTVILATGAKNRPLGLENEEQYVGKGVSYCATCDGVFFKNKEVAVVGGGNTALEDAVFLSAYCSKVYVINRAEQFKGEKRVIENLESKENVQCIFNAEVLRIEGEEILERIFVQNRQNGFVRKIDIAGMFVAIGQMPQNEVFGALVELDEKGYILAAEDCKTSAKGIFAAGDCRTKTVRQLTTAAADGAVAALAACDYLG